MAHANSTQMFVGLSSARNSSKVLRPPGGGSSDIFGLNEVEPENDEKAVPKQQAGAGADMIGVSDVDKENTKDTDNNEKKPHRGASSFQLGDEQPEDQEANCKRKSVDPLTGLILGEKVVEKEKGVEVAPPTKTGRIPPGGYSAGLW